MFVADHVYKNMGLATTQVIATVGFAFRCDEAGFEHARPRRDSGGFDQRPLSRHSLS
jgi:hypothetical protein